MYTLLFIVHLIIALMLCVVVLLQNSKGGGLAGAFGGAGAGEAMFGARGVTTFLHKATIYLAIAFMISSLGLAFTTANQNNNGSIAERAARNAPVSTTPVPVSSEDLGVDAEVVDEAAQGADEVVPPPPESEAQNQDEGSADGGGQ